MLDDSRSGESNGAGWGLRTPNDMIAFAAGWRISVRARVVDTPGGGGVGAALNTASVVSQADSALLCGIDMCGSVGISPVYNMLSCFILVSCVVSALDVLSPSNSFMQQVRRMMFKACCSVS
jgi:hypothetical protein